MSEQSLCSNCSQADCCCSTVNNHTNSRFWLCLAGVIILGAVIIVAILRDRIVNNQQWTVSITGQGKVAINPDLAKVTVEIETDRLTEAAAAYRRASEIMAKIIKAVKASGIEDKDLQTANYSLTPNYQYINGESNLSGYQAIQEVIVTVRDLAKLSVVIEKAAAAGANRITNVNFTVENIEQVKNQARLQAIAYAKQKSTDYAQSVWVKLGEITGWWENVIQIPYQNYNYSYSGEKGGMGAGGPGYNTNPVPYGPMDVVVEMNLSYRLK